MTEIGTVLENMLQKPALELLGGAGEKERKEIIETLQRLPKMDNYTAFHVGAFLMAEAVISMGDECQKVN